MPAGVVGDLMGAGAKLRKSWTRWLVGLLLVVGFAVLAVRAVTTEGTDAGAACEEPREPTGIDSSVDLAPEEIPEVGEQEAIQKRDHGRSRERFTVDTVLELSRPLTAGVEHLNVRAGQFQRADGTTLEPQQVTVTAHVDPDGRRTSVLVRTCIDPILAVPAEPGGTVAAAQSSGGSAEEPQFVIAQPGSYTGTVVIDDPRVSGGSATYTVNMKYEDIDRVVAAVAFSSLVGAGIGLLLASRLDWANLWTKDHRTRSFSALISCVTAGYAVYLAQYDTDPSWQGSASLFTSLMATCVAAAYAATNVAGTIASEPARTV